MSSKLTIVVDLDGTLKTDVGAVPPFEVETITTNCYGKEYIFGIRPHIEEFLKAAKLKGRLYLGTAAGGGYAEKMLRVLGITNYFDKVISAQDFVRGFPCLRNCIFIDNDHESGLLKINKMGKASTPIIRQDLWTIDTFLGDSDDKTMLELVEEIKQL